MVMGFRERRLGCRLYVDRQSDANILKKLDRMLVMVDFLTRRSLSREVLNWPMKKCTERRKRLRRPIGKRLM